MNKSPIKLNIVENKFEIGNLFTNRENHRGKIPPSEFKVTTPENPPLSKLVYNPVHMHGVQLKIIAIT